MAEPSSQLPSPSSGQQVVGQLLPHAVVIHIKQTVLDEILEYSDGDMRRERGGFLLGTNAEDVWPRVEILGFLPAEETSGSAGQLRFTHQTWSRLRQEAEIRYPHLQVVGWQHTHPNLGVFMSEYDKFIHRHFFPNRWQVALVVDPRRGEFAFFQWCEGEIVDCGFVACKK